RYSGTEDVVYGSTVSGRPAALPGSESMIGCFINTLPVRVQAAPGQELLAWLQGLQAGQMELRAWEHSPLVEVRRWSGLSGDRPLFEAILVFESFFQAGGSESRRVHQRTNFPLTLVVWPGTEIAFAARFYAGRFAAEDVARLLGYVRELLQAFVQEPVRLADLPLAPAHERAQVLREWNDTAGEIPAVPVHRLVAARAERDPEAPAVADASGRLTYGALGGNGGGPARHPQGRRSLPAARSGLPGRPAAPHAGRLGRAPPHRRKYGRGALVSGPAHHPSGRSGDRRRERPSAGGRGREDRSGLCPLHLGLDRPAEGGAGPPWRARQFPRLDAPAARPGRGRCPPRHHVSVLRHRRPGDLPPPARRRAAGDRPARRGLRRRPPVRAARRPPGDGDAGDYFDLAAADRFGLAGRGRDQSPVRRRVPAREPRRGASGARRRGLESLRPHRD